MASESTPGTFFGVAEEKFFWSGIKVDWLAAFLCFSAFINFYVNLLTNLPINFIIMKLNKESKGESPSLVRSRKVGMLIRYLPRDRRFFSKKYSPTY